MRWFFFPSIRRFPDDRPQTALLLPLFFPALRSAPSLFRKIPEAWLRGHVRNLFPTAQSAVFLRLPVQLTHHFLSENALFYSPFLKGEVTEKFSFPRLSLPYILTFRCLCNDNFVCICCQNSFFLFISDKDFYFQFGMCAFYGYFDCIAFFDCFYGEYRVSMYIRNFCLGCVF